jgi:hypothetical protein
MKRVKPKLKNKINIPVNIYKGEVLVKEADSIQEAARWLKEDTGDRFKLFSAITNGIWYYKPYSYNGHTYYFETDSIAVAQYFERINLEIIAKSTSKQTFHDVNPAKNRHPEWDTKQNTPEQTIEEVPLLYHI